MRKRTSSVKPSAGDPGQAGAQPPYEHLFVDRQLGVLFALWLVGRSTVEAIETRIGSSGLTGDEFAVYCLLDFAAPLTPTGLGTWMAAPPTTVSAFVKRLERRGHVVRRPNPDDGRSHLLELTSAGTAARDAAIAGFAPLLGEVERELGNTAGALTGELLALRRILDSARTRDPGESRPG